MSNIKENLKNLVVQNNTGEVIKIENDIFVPSGLAQVVVRMLGTGEIRTYETSHHFINQRSLEVGKRADWKTWFLPLFFLNHMRDITPDEER